MKKYKAEKEEGFLDYNKTIRKALLQGEIISGIATTLNDDLIAKFTEACINSIRYYSIWEKDLLEGKWHLLKFGRKKEVEPEWKEFVNSWKTQCCNSIRLIA